MEKPRFPPERNSPQLVQLQKEIYRHEERALGLSLTPEKSRFNQFVRDLKPPFAQLGGDMRRSQDIPSMSSMHKRMNSDYRSNPKLNQGIWAPPSRNLAGKYYLPLENASQLKERYDFNNRSPITWLAKQDPKAASASKKYNDFTPVQDFIRMNQQLNSKKVFKGMGYVKSNIFIQ